jgi:hypothetical protein
MLTDHSRTVMNRACSRWAVPVICLLAACAYLAIFLAHGHVALAFATSGIMLGYGGILLLLRRHSEVAAVLSGHGTDERRRQINLRAASFSLNVVVIVALATALGDLATGHDPGVWATTCVIIGTSYLAGVVIYSRRMGG